MTGCATLPTSAILVYPKTGHHYGHTYFGIEFKGTN